jgi:transketolase
MPTDIRDAFFDKICEYAIADERVIIITDDMDIFSLRNFKKTCPHRFINPGVAEQQIVNFAAGLASTGKKVIICGIASFVTFRCYEQIKVNICSMNLPIVIVGMGAGLSFSADGPTHHSIQDVSVMRSLPEIEIYNPCDSLSAQKCAEISYFSKSPVYVRMDKGAFPDIYENLALEHGYCNIITPDKTNVISTGCITHVVHDVIRELNINVGLIDVFKLKPFDDRIINEISHSNSIITIEEHTITGGLHSIVLESSSRLDCNIQVKPIALEDGQYIQYGTREFLQDQHGLSRKTITKALLKEEQCQRKLP